MTNLAGVNSLGPLTPGGIAMTIPRGVRGSNNQWHDMPDDFALHTKPQELMPDTRVVVMYEADYRIQPAMPASKIDWQRVIGWRRARDDE